MKQFSVDGNIDKTCDNILTFLAERNFTIFCNIDHQANATAIGLNMPAARTIVFGNPQAGTRLMQQDITVSFNLPLRIAVVEAPAGTTVIIPGPAYFENNYNLKNHPVTQAIRKIFTELVVRLTSHRD